jgi:B-box zinc finger
MTPGTPRCSAHPARPAGWRCTECQRTLCPACAVEVELEVWPASYVKCGPCGGAVHLLTRPGSDASFVVGLRQALLLPVGLWGLVLLSGLAAAASELDTLAPPVREATLLVWGLCAWLLGVAIVRATAEGATRLQKAPQKAWLDVLRPALLCALLTAPALLVPRTGVPGALLVLAAAPLLVPLLLLVLAGRPWREALSPREAIRTLRDLGSDGVLAVSVSAGVWLFSRMLAGFAESPPEEVPLLWMKVLDVLGAFSLFLVPHVLGLLLEARGETLGYRFSARAEVPLLPGVRPETTVAYHAPEAPRRAPSAPISVDEETEGKLDLE